MRLGRVLVRTARAVLARLEDPAAIRRNVFVAAKLLPLQGTAPYLVVPRVSSSSAGSDLDIPPKDLWEGYGATAEDYLRCGTDDVAAMVTLLNAAGLSMDRVSRVLDFGCAAGRMLRHFPRGRSDLELWGVDIKARPIAWCQQHFGPPFRFATTTTLPHLPFEDNYFDLVYGGSVFTHIADLADAWLLELKRVLRPDGFAYITIHDGHTVELLRGRYRGRSDYGRITPSCGR
jgi:SAM-dependent methyltransferase